MGRPAGEWARWLSRRRKRRFDCYNNGRLDPNLLLENATKADQIPYGNKDVPGMSELQEESAPGPVAFR